MAAGADAAGLGEVPTLDWRHFAGSGAPQQREAFLRQLRAACEETGFVVLDNAVSPPLAAAALRQASSFFALPLAQKQTIAMAKSAQFRGFVELCAENTAGQPDCREQVEFAAEEPPGRDDGALWERLR